jgi:hypothetical protein
MPVAVAAGLTFAVLLVLTAQVAQVAAVRVATLAGTIVELQVQPIPAVVGAEAVRVAALRLAATAAQASSLFPTLTSTLRRHPQPDHPR